MLRLPLLTTVLLCLVTISTQAQDSPSFSGEIAFVKSSETTPTGKSNSPNTSIYRVAKKLSYIYNGFAFEIAASNLPLDKYHPIFKQFGNVYYHKLIDGGYSYLILADFSDQNAAETFLKDIIKPKVQAAKLFNYKDGNRRLVAE